MSDTLANKVIAITGGASGIGLATARLLAKRGALLSLADINEAALESAVATLSAIIPASSIFTSVVNVTSASSCNDWIANTVAYFSQPIYGAANLAGVFGPNIGREEGEIRNITDDEFNRVMTINVTGTLNSMRAELAHIQTGANGRGGGSIVNASSVAGIRGGLRNGPYVASKHAVGGMTRTAALEEGLKGIRINAVAPGIIETPMLKQIEDAVGTKEIIAGKEGPGPMERRGTAEEVAQVIVFLLSGESSFVTGVVVPVDGGWTA